MSYDHESSEVGRSPAQARAGAADFLKRPRIQYSDVASSSAATSLFLFAQQHLHISCYFCPLFFLHQSKRKMDHLTSKESVRDHLKRCRHEYVEPYFAKTSFAHRLMDKICGDGTTFQESTMLIYEAFPSDGTLLSCFDGLIEEKRREFEAKLEDSWMLRMVTWTFGLRIIQSYISALLYCLMSASVVQHHDQQHHHDKEQNELEEGEETKEDESNSLSIVEFFLNQLNCLLFVDAIISDEKGNCAKKDATHQLNALQTRCCTLAKFALWNMLVNEVSMSHHTHPFQTGHTVEAALDFIVNRLELQLNVNEGDQLRDVRREFDCKALFTIVCDEKDGLLNLILALLVEDNLILPEDGNIAGDGMEMDPFQVVARELGYIAKFFLSMLNLILGTWCLRGWNFAHANSSRLDQFLDAAYLRALFARISQLSDFQSFPDLVYVRNLVQDWFARNTVNQQESLIGNVLQSISSPYRIDHQVFQLITSIHFQSDPFWKYTNPRGTQFAAMMQSFIDDTAYKAAEYWTNVAENFCQNEASHPAEKALVYYTKGELYRMVNRMVDPTARQRAFDAYAQALQILGEKDKLYSMDHVHCPQRAVVLAKIHFGLGKQFLEDFDLPRASVHLKMCLDLRQEFLPHDHTDLAQAYFALASLGVRWLQEDRAAAIQVTFNTKEMVYQTLKRMILTQIYPVWNRPGDYARLGTMCETLSELCFEGYQMTKAGTVLGRSEIEKRISQAIFYLETCVRLRRRELGERNLRYQLASGRVQELKQICEQDRASQYLTGQVGRAINDVNEH